VQSIRPALRRRLPDSQTERAGGRYLVNSEGRALNGELAPPPRISPSREVVSRAHDIRDREGRGSARRRTTSTLHSIIRSGGVARGLTGIFGNRRRIFAGVDLTCEPTARATVHTTWGGIATNYHRRVLTKKNGKRQTPGAGP